MSRLEGKRPILTKSMTDNYIYIIDSKTLDFLINYLKTFPDKINNQDKIGRTVLHWICQYSYTDAIGRMVEFLLSHPDIGVNLQDKYGCTVLHYACKKKQIKIVQMLFVKEHLRCS